MTDAVIDTTAPAPDPTTTEPTRDMAEPVGRTVADALSAQEVEVQNKQFMEQLPEALRGMPALKSIKGTADLATQFVNQQALIGNSLRIPTEDTDATLKEDFYKKLSDVPGVVRIPRDGADEAEIKEFQTKLGVPSTPQEYKINLPEGKTLEPEVLQQAAESAYNLGLTPTQLNKVLIQEIEAREAAEIAHTDYIEQSKIKLKSMWGQDYDTRVAGATNAFRVYKEEFPEHASELNAVANNPMLVKLLSDMGEMLQERGHAGMQSAGNYGMTVEEAKLKKEEIMNNADHPYHKGETEAVTYMYKLHEIIASANL